MMILRLRFCLHFLLVKFVVVEWALGELTLILVH